MGCCSAKHDSKKAINDIPFKMGHDLFINLKGSEYKENYKIERTLGKGAQGEVFLVQHKTTNTFRAMKQIAKSNLKLSEDESQIMYNEVQILKYLDHPNIVKIYELYEDNHNLYIITEFLSGGELQSRLYNPKNKDKLSEQQIAGIMKSILEGLAHCHAKQIMHRDLKPQNVLFESDENDAEVKIIDFGLAFKDSLDVDPTQEMVGTMLYMSPEVAIGTTYYDNKCDLWSCGVMLMQMLTSKVPYSRLDLKQLSIVDEMRALTQERLDQMITQFDRNLVSDKAKQLMKLMLIIDPEKRINAQGALAHPWISNTNNKPLDRKVIDNLCSFHVQSKLAGAIMQLIATQMLHKEETQILKQQFKAIDKDGDGQITKEELKKGYLKLYKDDEFKASTQTDYIFEKADLNHSGTIDYTEFLTAASEQAKLLSQDRVEKAFKMFDKDGNGYITIKELQQVMAGADIIKQQWKDLINDFDQDHDGMISHKEFTETFLKAAQ